MTQTRITYCIFPSPLGRLLAAGTGKGVCFLAMGDDDQAILAELYQDYPSAQPAETGSHTWQLGKRTLAWLESLYARGVTASTDGELLSIPVDAGGTAFQQKVWQALRSIPAGRYLTYTQLAEQLNMPGGVRAVAHACASNPVSILIPCHRTRRRDGGFGGYRWGLERKQSLLKAEGALNPP